MKRQKMKTQDIRGTLLMLAVVVAAGSLAPSCDVHEFPEQHNTQRNIILHLDFQTDLPEGQTVEYTTRTPASDNYDTRYQVRVYKVGDDGSTTQQACATIVETRNDVSDLDLNIRLTLEEGNYRFLVWTDFVAAGTTDDLYYDTDDFGEITVNTVPYTGNTAFRDAFRGDCTATVAPVGTNDITVDMVRPLARYEFVTTDYDTFITRVLQAIQSRNTTDTVETKAIDLDDYRIVFRYTGYMPSAFNMFTDKPIDSSTGITFDGRISQLSDTEALLGLDYVFVNGKEASVQTDMQVYNAANEIIAATEPIDIPLERSKCTIVRGPFLTTTAAGSVGIDPGFDGDWNIEIK